VHQDPTAVLVALVMVLDTTMERAVWSADN
jgi:hypothetical protein